MKESARIVKSSWQTALQVATMIVGVVCSFLLLPSSPLLDETAAINLSRFIAAAVLMLLFSFVQLSTRKHLRLLLVLSSFTLLLSFFLIYNYLDEFSAKTVRYRDEVMVAGTEKEMTPEASLRKKEIEAEHGKSFNREELIYLAAGNIGGIWSEETRRSNLLDLVLWFNACIISCSLFFILVTQVYKVRSQT